MGGRGTQAKAAATGRGAPSGQGRRPPVLDFRRSIVGIGRAAQTRQPLQAAPQPAARERSAIEKAMTVNGYMRVYEDGSQTFYRHHESRQVFVAMAGRVHPATAEQQVRLAQGQPPPRAGARMTEAEVRELGCKLLAVSWSGRVYEVRQVAGNVLPVKATFRFKGLPDGYRPSVNEADAQAEGYRLTVSDHQGRVYEKSTGEWQVYDYTPPRPRDMTEAQAKGWGYQLVEETPNERVWVKGSDQAVFDKPGYDRAAMETEVRQLLGLEKDTRPPRAGYRPPASTPKAPTVSAPADSPGAAISTPSVAAHTPPPASVWVSAARVYM